MAERHAAHERPGFINVAAFAGLRVGAPLPGGFAEQRDAQDLAAEEHEPQLRPGTTLLSMRAASAASSGVISYSVWPLMRGSVADSIAANR